MNVRCGNLIVSAFALTLLGGLSVAAAWDSEDAKGETVQALSVDSPMSAGGHDGAYRTRSGSGSLTGRNNTDYLMTVYAYGGSRSGSNQADLRIRVDGVTVSRFRRNYHRYAVTGFVSAEVPPGSSYQVSSSPYNSGSGSFRVREFRRH